VDIFGAVILQECIPITILSLAAFPKIRRINAEDTPPPLNVTSAPVDNNNDTPTQAPSTKNPGDGAPTATDSPVGETPSETPQTQNPGTDVPSTDSAGFVLFGPLMLAFGTIVAPWRMMIF
jgi:hypothetical protein